MSDATDRLRAFLTISPSVVFPDEVLELFEPVETEVTRLADENAKLRELVLDMFGVIDDSEFDPIVERQGKRGPYYEEDMSWRVGIRDRMRELGIEVTENE